MLMYLHLPTAYYFSLYSCFKWFMGSPRQLRRGSSCTISGFKKFFRKVFLYFFNNCCSKKSLIFLLVGYEYLCCFGCRSLKGLSYARFGDIFTKYNPPTRNQNSFRFVSKASYTLICLLFCSFSTYPCMINCQYACFVRVCEDMLAHFITNDSRSLALKYILYTMRDMTHVMDPSTCV